MPEVIKKQTQQEKERVTDPNKFDLRTHDFNARGQKVGANAYRLWSKDGVGYFERPVNSGNLFYENNEHAGRLTVTRDSKGRITGKKFLPEEQHTQYAAPLEGTEKLEHDLLAAKRANEQLVAELAAIHAERKGTAAGQTSMPDMEAKPAQAHVSPSLKDAPLSAMIEDIKQAGMPGDPLRAFEKQQQEKGNK